MSVSGGAAPVASSSYARLMLRRVTALGVGVVLLVLCILVDIQIGRAHV